MSLEFLVREINLVEQKIKRREKEMNYGDVDELKIILAYLLELKEREFEGCY